MCNKKQVNTHLVCQSSPSGLVHTSLYESPLSPHTHSPASKQYDVTHNIRFATTTAITNNLSVCYLERCTFAWCVQVAQDDLIQSFSFSSSGAVAAALCAPGGELTQTDSRLNALGASFHGDRAWNE